MSTTRTTIMSRMLEKNVIPKMVLLSVAWWGPGREAELLLITQL